MKNILTICLIIAGFMVSGNARAGVPFLPNFEDVPAMSGLDVINSEGFLFSVPEGKIVETFVQSETLTRRQFQRFYREALKGLGWKLGKDGSKIQEFSRDDDVLRIEILATSPLEARFSLSPAGAE
jgi:hypothetical protein